MRPARFSWVLLPLVVVALTPGFVAATASAAPLPPFADSITIQRPAAAVIHLRDGDSIAVAYVGPWAMHAVRYDRLDGGHGYLSTHKIVRVVSADGVDCTGAVLRDRRALGESATSHPRSIGSWIASLAPSFHDAPTRRAKAYLLLESSVVGRGRQSGVGGDGTLILTGIGGMANVSPSWSLGGVAQISNGSQDEYVAGGLGLRVRRYVSDRASVDLTQGVFSGEGDSWSTRGVAYFGESALTLADALSLVARVESATWDAHGRYRVVEDDGWVPIPPRRVSRTVWRFGARLGPSPRWFTIPAFAVGSLFVLLPRGTNSY